MPRLTTLLFATLLAVSTPLLSQTTTSGKKNTTEATKKTVGPNSNKRTSQSGKKNTKRAIRNGVRPQSKTAKA